MRKASAHARSWALERERQIMATTVVEEVTSPVPSVYLPTWRPWMALYSVRLKPRGYREEDEQVGMGGTPAPSIAVTWHQHSSIEASCNLRLRCLCMFPAPPCRVRPSTLTHRFATVTRAHSSKSTGRSSSVGAGGASARSALLGPPCVSAHLMTAHMLQQLARPLQACTLRQAVTVSRSRWRPYRRCCRRRCWPRCSSGYRWGRWAPRSACAASGAASGRRRTCGVRPARTPSALRRRRSTCGCCGANIGAAMDQQCSGLRLLGMVRMSASCRGTAIAQQRWASASIGRA